MAEDTYERALQLGTDVPLAIALSTRANAAAYEGKAAAAHEAAEAALGVFLIRSQEVEPFSGSHSGRSLP